MLRDLELGVGLVLPAACFDLRFARSGGPGGPHVNKTETKVDLRCDLTRALPVLGEERVARIRTKLANRLDADGRVLLTCEEFRSRHQNIEAAFERMAALLRTAMHKPKARKKTKPTRSSQMKRLDEKKQRGAIKRGRRGGDE
ncbi:MAG: aminoacyl-tRNA hydrolase [Planctomycetes bacterium]|nr:aminoacyl-tRNA hydrolase [Planctomycetota bacterium]